MISHTPQPDPRIIIARDAVAQLVGFCAGMPGVRFTVLSDTNTHRVLGGRIEQALIDAGLPVIGIVLHGAEVIADERYLTRTLVQAPPEPQVFIAAGSGTLTDIARYVSFRTGNPFISAPSAASVDGFLSLIAPLVIGGVKDTYAAQGPLAVFADLTTLAEAPRALTAAGFGDLLGKVTSLADWRLGHLLWDEPYDPEIDERTRRAMNRCIDAAQDIASGSEDGVRLLLEGLLESGLCMRDFGDSRPASGAEHHLSHFWEMQLLKEGRPAILHGAKVGVASALIAQLYDHVRRLSQEDVRELIRRAPAPDPASDVDEIRRVYGEGAEQIERIQAAFLSLTTVQQDQLRQRVVERWPDIQTIARTVPPAETITGLLATAGGPTDWRALGLERRMVEPSLLYGHYLRSRFTVLKLFRLLGLDARLALERPL